MATDMTRLRAEVAALREAADELAGTKAAALLDRAFGAYVETSRCFPKDAAMEAAYEVLTQITFDELLAMHDALAAYRSTKVKE